MDCWSAANLPRLAEHSLSMASKARVTNPPAAPAMAAADLPSPPPPGRGGASGEEMEWLDPRRGDARSGETGEGLDLGASLVDLFCLARSRVSTFNGSPRPFAKFSFTAIYFALPRAHDLPRSGRLPACTEDSVRVRKGLAQTGEHVDKRWFILL